MTDETQDLIARLWIQFAPLARARVTTLAGYLRHLSTSTPAGDGAPTPIEPTASAVEPTHAQARQAAHDLVGSLGSYGRPRGSEIAAALEALLGDGTTRMSPADLHRAGRLVDELEGEVRP